MVRPATPLGPVGLILPTFPQTIQPSWSAISPSSRTTGSTNGTGAPGPETACDPLAELAETCRAAEALGVDALWATDHLFWHGPALECMTALTVAATATRRAMLGTCVVQLPLRQAPAIAKQAASLQSLTQGRMVLGVGVGSHAGEYEVSGIDYATRGRQLDEGIAQVRRAWESGSGSAGGDIGVGDAAGGVAAVGNAVGGDTAGGHIAVGDIAGGSSDRYRQLPAPPAIPLWVGGSSEVALRRAASSADGWIPMLLAPAEYSAALARLAKEIDRANRPDDAVTRSVVLFASIDDDTDEGLRRGTEWMSSLYGIPAKAFRRHLVAGSAESVARTVTDYRAAGAEHVVLYITDDQPLPQVDRLMAALSLSAA
jgi:alkanesulfonate monooxygenase SsuD/methylene tetrahydromethanopterin reductase-like flavin-dependent oxidoreductase (luciferase family)